MKIHHLTYEDLLERERQGIYFKDLVLVCKKLDSKVYAVRDVSSKKNTPPERGASDSVFCYASTSISSPDLNSTVSFSS